MKMIIGVGDTDDSLFGFGGWFLEGCSPVFVIDFAKSSKWVTLHFIVFSFYLDF